MTLNGEHTGMSSDYAAIFRQLLPVPLVWLKTNSWPESLKAAQEHRCDLLLMVMDVPSRREHFLFSPAYLTVPSAIVTTTDKPSVTSLADLAGKPIGIRAGVGFLDEFQQRFPQVKFVLLSTYEEGMLQVQAGSIYGMLGNLGSLSQLLQKYQITNLKIAGQLGDDNIISIASSRAEPELNQIMTAALNKIPPELHQQILQRWIQPPQASSGSSKLLLQLLLLVSGIAAIGWYAFRKVQALNQELRRANQQLEQQSVHDRLTGLFNRHYLDAQLPALVSLCQRQQLPLTLAMLDLDFFKQINDKHGHLFGDFCLQQFSKLLQQAFQRPHDILVRFGGEEFLLVCSGVSPVVMETLLEQFIHHLAAQTFREGEHEAQCTVSIGLFSEIPCSQLQVRHLYQLADEALYRAKHAGRNQLCKAKPSESLFKDCKTGTAIPALGSVKARGIAGGDTGDTDVESP